MIEYNIIKDSTELRKLIQENPDLPICVLAGEEASDGEHYSTYCSYVKASIEEILDCEVPYMEEVETDRDYFDEQIEEWLWDKMSGDDSEPNEKEFQLALEKEKSKYDPYWKKCICIYASN